MERCSLPKVVLVTGASHGIGRSIALHLAKNGYITYATMPDPEQWQNEKIPSLHVKFLDVTHEASISMVISEILEKEGRLDVLVNNAGVAIFGAAETISIEQAKTVFDINFFGALRMVQAVLPIMRKQKNGLIVNLSSVNGIRPSLGYDIYSSSKFALEGLSEALATTLSIWNIKVVLVQPGPVITSFTDSAMEGNRFLGDDNPYGKLIEKCKQRLKSRRSTGQSPDEISKIVEKIIDTESPSLRYQTSSSSLDIAKMKFQDPTGNQMIEMQKKALESLLNTSY